MTAMLLPKNPKAIDIQSIDNSFARSPWTFAIYSHPKSNVRRTGEVNERRGQPMMPSEFELLASLPGLKLFRQFTYRRQMVEKTL